MRTHEKIRQLRETKQWTQEQMATKLNMSTQGYAKIERGDTRSNLDRLEQISEVFGIDMIELLSFGEGAKIDFNSSTNTDSFNHAVFGGGNTELEIELKHLQSVIEYKDEIITNLKNEIALLREMNEILKNK